MAEDFVIQQGLDISLEGAPGIDVVDVSETDVIVLHPSEFTRSKPRLQVQVGDAVKQGSVLFFDKKNESFKFRSPVAGVIKDIVLGERRSLQEIHIEKKGSAKEQLKSFTPDGLLSADSVELAEHLADSGLLTLIQERPFSRPATLAERPKSIFVNGMCNAPFRPDIHVLAETQAAEFQAGLNALTRLTSGVVHLCLDRSATTTHPAVCSAQNVDISYFSGPHPSGNTSTHIHQLDPIHPGDVVWAINACDLIQIGELLLTGLVPSTRTIVAGGTGLKASERCYYKVSIGQPLASIVDGRLDSDEARVIAGDVFAGESIKSIGLPWFCRGLTVLHEDRKRHLLGWMMPGYDSFSTSRAYMSKWFGSGRSWNMGTSRNGSRRAMVLTGIYDKYVPLDIMVDYLSRACIAHDTDDAIRHGILSTDPEDFALCSVTCPSKTDFSDIIRKGLQEIEAEGI